MSDPVYTPLAWTPDDLTQGRVRAVNVSEWSGHEYIYMTPAEHLALLVSVSGDKSVSDKSVSAYYNGTLPDPLRVTDGTPALRNWVKLKLAYLRAGMGI